MYCSVRVPVTKPPWWAKMMTGRCAVASPVGWYTSMTSAWVAPKALTAEPYTTLCVTVTVGKMGWK